MKVTLRPAVPADVPALRALIDASVRGLQAHDYTPAQIERALESVFGVDSQLIADGTYFVAEIAAAQGRSPQKELQKKEIAGCGGWSKRKTLFGGDQWRSRHDDLLDPARDPAKIRSFFIHPKWARHGLGSMILKACEDAAKAAGFTRCEMAATLTGVKLFQARGYLPLEPVDVPLGDGISLPVIRMAKKI